ncbi:MAG: NADP-dependent malic enzyme [Bacteroidia bacterium]|nr:MAG: NADP-dependent malic enzyme [Bacteroidia bacterium]
MCDSKGVINSKRTNLNAQKQQFVTQREINTLEKALIDADVFLGLSVADIMTPKMLKSMAKDPIVFALANPNPEIDYELAVQTRPDVIMATGRSDYPNQINNVLGFPYIFRGALDVRASSINEEMKIACVYAIAELAQEFVPESVNIAYNERNIVFGREYIVPKALDPRLIAQVATAVAKAAIASGVARRKITDWEAYAQDLNKKLGIENELLRSLHNKAKRQPKRVVFPEGDNYNIIKAASIVAADQIAFPILLGNKDTIARIASENELDISNIEIIDISKSSNAEKRTEYAKIFSKKRERNGLTYKEARENLFSRNYFAAMMVEVGDADAMITGHSIKYYSAIRIVETVIGTEENMHEMTGVNIMMTKRGPLFFADTITTAEKNVDRLVSTTLATAQLVKRFNITPRIAMLSYANFGAAKEKNSLLVHKTVAHLHEQYPDLIVDGEISVNFALNKEKRNETFPFSKLKEQDVNTLIFPTLDAANISYNLLKELGGVESIGPILVGAAKPIHIVSLNASVRDIVNMTTVAVVDAQRN